MKYLLMFIICLPSLLIAQNKDSYEIYRQIILNDFKNDSLITIENVTTIGIGNELEHDYNYFKDVLKTLKFETFKDFKIKNSKPDTISDNFNCKSFKVVILTSSIIDSIFTKGKGWSDFYEKFGKTQGMLSFSKIGFDKKRSQALLYYGNQSDWEAGIGYYILFEKKNGKWIEVSSVMAWIS